MLHITPEFSFDSTAFMSGQMRSKLWLVTRLEQIAPEIFGSRPLDIWLLGGWYALTAFIIFTRDRLRVSHISTFDIDDHATQGAMVLNESLAAIGKFSAATCDVSVMDYCRAGTEQLPDLVINTSVEHMPDERWWDAIPAGMIVALQSNNMPHDDEVSNIPSLRAMIEKYPLTEVLYEGENSVNHDDRYQRFMIIGRK